MPITGLTDRSPSFREVGRLRLGIPKNEAAKSGPKEIGYFRPDFRPDEPQAFADFLATYGNQPVAINFRLPFVQINRCWDAFYEVYNTSGLLGMADGEKWLYLRDNKTGNIIVKDGLPEMAFDKSVPVYAYKSKKGEDVAVYAKPTGRLKIVIPELKRAAFVTVVTHSIYNVMRISEQLAGIEVVAQNMNTTLPMIPMVLTRTKERISVSFSGKKQYQDRYLINIEINPIWAEAHFAALDRLLPGASLPELPALPHEVEETSADEYEPEAEANDLPYVDENGEVILPEQTSDKVMETEPGKMSRKTAADVTTTKGERYGDMNRDYLLHIASEITKALEVNNITPEYREELQFKLDATSVLLSQPE